jgi:uncharacterized protein (TIRG00374 family)
MKRAIAIFTFSLGLGVFGLWLVYRDELLRPENYRLAHPNPLLIAVIALAFAGQILAPALKLLLLCRYQDMPMKFRKAVPVHLATVFGAVITPSNSGGAPATVMALSRLGYPVGKAVGVASQIFLLDLIFFAWAGPLGLAYLIYSRRIQLPLKAEILTVVAVVVAVGVAVALSRYPRRISSGLIWLAGRPFLRRFEARLKVVARDYYRSAQAYLRLSGGNYAALQAFTALSWLSSYVMLWALLRLYEEPANLLVLTALLANISLVANFVPTPGGSGFIEAAVGLTAVGASATAPLVLWRALNYYVFFLLGPLAGLLLYRSRPLLRLPRPRRPRLPGRGRGRKGGGKARP